jgi:hypothetical protein
MTTNVVVDDSKNSMGGAATRFDRFAALAVLTALGVTWPVLDLLGRNAEFFVARRSPKWEIVALSLALAVGVPLLVALVGSLPGRLGSMLGTGLIALTSASLTLLYLKRLPVSWWVATAIAGALGVAAAWAFHRFDPARLFARYLSPAPLVLVAVFLFTSPTGAVLADEGSAIGSPVSAASPAPIVMLVFDEFPVASLIDADGDLRADRYPNFARLAADATFYPNAMTVEQQTEHSVPAMLTGVVPDQSKTPYAGQYPENLFTAFQESHELHVLETITQLCPRSLCEGIGQSTTPILRDVGVVAGHVLLPEGLATNLPQIDRGWGDFGAATSDFDVVAEFRENFEADPRKPIATLIDQIGGPAGAKPPLFFLHAVVPHHPWQFLPDGRRYPLTVERAPGSKSPGWGPDEFLVAQAMQRHLLQVGYIDHALGEILDALEAADLYDEAMIVLVADHGIAVRPNVPHQRQISADTIGEVAAIPFFVKSPRQTEGGVDQRRALTIDIVPTIADVLDADLPWETDGVSLLGPDPGRAESTTIGPYSEVTIGAAGTEKLEVAARIESLFPGGNPWALRPAGSPDLLGTTVDGSDLASSGIMVHLERPLFYTVVDTGGDVIPARFTASLIGGVTGDEVLAVAVNGTIGAMTRSYLEEGDAFFQAMLPPELFVDGENEIGVYLVTGDGTLERVERSN